MTVQSTYEINPDTGFIGDLAEPSAPHHVDSGVIHVPAAATRIPRPGDPVYYDTTENAFAIPTTQAQTIAAFGVLTYRKDQVANADSFVEFADEDEVEVLDFGTIWVELGSAAEYGQQISWNRADFKWDPVTRITATADLYIRPVEMVGRFAGVDTSIVKARIGYGRVI